MESLVNLILFFAACFSTALGAAYVIADRLRKKLPWPENGSVLVLRSDSGIYRSHLVERGDRGWRVSSPLQRDRFVPFRSGESILVQAPIAGGVMMFRTKVCDRSASDHTYLLGVPEQVHRLDRRESERRYPVGLLALVDGCPAEVIDYSAGGASMRSERPLARGDRVMLTIDGGTLGAWVLAAEGRNARLRFEEWLNLESETAPA